MKINMSSVSFCALETKNVLFLHNFGKNSAASKISLDSVFDALSNGILEVENEGRKHFRNLGFEKPMGSLGVLDFFSTLPRLNWH